MCLHPAAGYAVRQTIARAVLNKGQLCTTIRGALNNALRYIRVSEQCFADPVTNFGQCSGALGGVYERLQVWHPEALDVPSLDGAMWCAYDAALAKLA